MKKAGDITKDIPCFFAQRKSPAKKKPFPYRLIIPEFAVPSFPSEGRKPF